MSYGSGPVSKIDYARYLTACLLHFSRKQRDRVGLVTFDTEVVEYVPASARNLELALHTLDRTNPGRPGELRPALLQCAERLVRRGMVFLVSDFYEEPDVIMESLALLKGRGHDLMVFHLLDPAERELPGEGATTFQDLETEEITPIVPEQLRDGYREMIEAHVTTLQERCTGNRIDYVLLDTSQPLDHALFRYLTIRERKARGR
jgi:uncharacterized protein (DUF58 family)